MFVRSTLCVNPQSIPQRGKKYANTHAYCNIPRSSDGAPNLWYQCCIVRYAKIVWVWSQWEKEFVHTIKDRSTKGRKRPAIKLKPYNTYRTEKMQPKTLPTDMGILVLTQNMTWEWQCSPNASEKEYEHNNKP